MRQLQLPRIIAHAANAWGANIENGTKAALLVPPITLGSDSLPGSHPGKVRYRNRIDANPLVQCAQGGEFHPPPDGPGRGNPFVN